MALDLRGNAWSVAWQDKQSPSNDFVANYTPINGSVANFEQTASSNKILVNTTFGFYASPIETIKTNTIIESSITFTTSETGLVKVGSGTFLSPNGLGLDPALNFSRVICLERKQDGSVQTVFSLPEASMLGPMLFNKQSTYTVINSLSLRGNIPKGQGSVSVGTYVSLSPVPEPSTLALLGFTLVPLLRRTQRCRYSEKKA